MANTLTIITRAEAKAQGLTRYFTGKPCPQGHVADRSSSSAGCCECSRERDKKRVWKDRPRPDRSDYFKLRAATPHGRLMNRKAALKYNFGLLWDAYQQLLADQNQSCALCCTPLDRSTHTRLPHVDHDHATGKVRAILCHACNTGLGKFKDDPELLDLASAYLRKHRAQ